MTAFVLGILGCVPFVGLAAVVVGLVALMRKQARRRLASAGIALGLLWMLLFTWMVATDAPLRFLDALESMSEPKRDATGQVTESGWLDLSRLRVGDCGNSSAAKAENDGFKQTSTVEVVPCDDPHNVEVFYVEALPEGRYPGQHAVLTRAEEVCAAEFTKFIGLPYDDSVIEGFYYVPNERDWASHDHRSITCLAAAPGETTGTLRDARR